MKPICHPCQRFFRPEKTGFSFIEGMPKDSATVPGTSMPESWEPYKLWVGDLWKCQGCGAQIVVGVASNPVAEHYQDEFKGLAERFNATYQVNDC